MKQDSYVDIISDQTRRALWEVQNVISCIPDDLWNKQYLDMPLWKHVYHMVHSLDLWFINPRDRNFKEPAIHVPDLNNLDVVSDKELTRYEIDSYYSCVREKIKMYLDSLQDIDLLHQPQDCDYTRYTLILAQHRHLHTHMGMIMGFIIYDTGQWPRVVGLEGEIPEEESYELYF
jgi:hypothetical protein